MLWLVVALLVSPSLALAMIPSAASRYAASMGLACEPSEGACLVCEDGTFDVELKVSVRDIDEDRRRSLTHHFNFNPASSTWRRTSRIASELPAEASFVGHSPSGRRTVRVLKVKRGEGFTCIEVYEGPSLLVRASAEGVHEGVSAGSSGLGGLSWSPDEGTLVYVAERTKPAAASWFKGLGADKEAGSGRGREREFRDDWGEKLPGSDRLALFALDVSSVRAYCFAPNPLSSYFDACPSLPHLVPLHPSLAAREWCARCPAATAAMGPSRPRSPLCPPTARRSFSPPTRTPPRSSAWCTASSGPATSAAFPSPPLPPLPPPVARRC